MSKTKSKTKVFMQMHGGGLDFCDKLWHGIFSDFKGSLKEGEIVEMVFQKRRSMKTPAQLGYWYAVLMPFAVEELKKAGWDRFFVIQSMNRSPRLALYSTMSESPEVEVNLENTDSFFKDELQAFKQSDELPLKRNMTDQEMSELIDFTIDWLNKNLQVMPPPRT